MSNNLQKDKKEIEAKGQSDALSYTGKINVSLMKGKKVYFNKQYKNKGRWPLFFFIASCLKGDYSVAEMYRPKYINVFGSRAWIRDAKAEPDFRDDSTNYLLHDWFKNSTNLSIVSYPTMAACEIKTNQAVNIGFSAITYKFNIPFSQLKDKNYISAFALYAEQVRSGVTEPTETSNVSNPCAFFFLTDENGKILNLMEGYEQADFSDEYNLYIEWTLSLANATTIHINPDSDDSDPSQDAENSVNSSNHVYETYSDAQQLAQSTANIAEDAASN